MNIWLFGAGKFGQDYVDKYGCDLCKGFVDNDLEKKERIVRGLKVFTYSEFKDRFDSNNDEIYITCAKVEDICIQLQKDGLMASVKVYMPGTGIVSMEDMWGQHIYSQLGEEMGLIHYFCCNGLYDDYKGFYLDIGAYHPFIGNNTYWAYKKGWRGINIDANAESISLFEVFRPDDININCGVSDQNGESEYYVFHEAQAMNTFVAERKNVKAIEDVKLVKMRNINEILEEYNVEKIDFIDIDVEGSEEKIVYSFDWKKYKPKCALIEFLEQRSIEDVLQTTIHKKMKEEGYLLKSYYTVTALYIKSKGKI